MIAVVVMWQVETPSQVIDLLNNLPPEGMKSVEVQDEPEGPGNESHTV